MTEEIPSSTSTSGLPASLLPLLPKKLHSPLETAALWCRQSLARPSSIQGQSRFVGLPAQAPVTRCQRSKRTRSRHVRPCARRQGVCRTQHVAAPTVRYSEQALVLCEIQSSDLLLHHFFNTLLNALCFTATATPAVDACRHTGDDAHKITDQIILGFIGKDRFNAASLDFQQRREVVPAKARAPVFVFHNDRANACVSQELQKLWATVIETRSDLGHFFGNLVAPRCCIVAQTLHLAV